MSVDVTELNGTTGFRGAKVEMEVATDLMTRGFHVYRNMSPVGPVDMFALSPVGEVLKVQATMGHCGKRGHSRRYDRHLETPYWDIIAVRFPDKVRYYSREGTELHPGREPAPPPPPVPVQTPQHHETPLQVALRKIREMPPSILPKDPIRRRRFELWLEIAPSMDAHLSLSNRKRALAEVTRRLKSDLRWEATHDEKGNPLPLLPMIDTPLPDEEGCTQDGHAHGMSCHVPTEVAEGCCEATRGSDGHVPE